MAATSSSRTFAERSGRGLARIWKASVRQEIRLARWSAAQGMPPWLATALLWLLKIVLVIIVGYALFWLAVVLTVVFVAAKIFSHAEVDAEPYAWESRQGFLGFGVYDKSGQRIDPHDPTEND